MFPNEFYHSIGLISLGWGVYDGHFNRLLASLLDATKDDSEPVWRGLDYKRRRKLCRKNIVVHYRMRPALKTYLEKILDDSAVIHNKRNSILHGKISLQLKSNPGDTELKPHLFIKSRINGKEAEFLFDADDLETLAYQIMHLTGRLNLTFQTPVQGLSSHDMHALEALLSRIPIETMLP